MAKAALIHKLTRPNAPLRDSAHVLLLRMQEMMEWSVTIRDPRQVAELHNMRIAAKRLRYTMELFAPCFGKDFSRSMKIAEDIQESIGRIHDCDMLIPLLKKTVEKETKREQKQALRKGGALPQFLAAEGLVALLTDKQADRVRLYDAFIVFWDKLPPEGFLEQLTQIVYPDAGKADTGTSSEGKNH